MAALLDAPTRRSRTRIQTAQRDAAEGARTGRQVMATLEIVVKAPGDDVILFKIADWIGR